MSAGTCIALVCSSTLTRRYITGPQCDEHAPWAIAGHPDPSTLIDPERTDRAMRVQSASPWVKGGTDINKERPGGYVSKPRALKIAAERDAIRGAS